VIAPILGGHSAEVALTDHNGTKMEITENGIIETVEVTKEVKVSMSEQDGMSVAEVTIETTKGGETTTETKTFTGTEEEVKAQIEALKNVDVKVKAQK
jgi:K(+)-stimulated pyrophosphate-energized sodium pump